MVHGNIIFPPPRLLAPTVTPSDCPFRHPRRRSTHQPQQSEVFLCVSSWPSRPVCTLHGSSDSLVTPGPSLASPTLHTRFHYAARSQGSTTRRLRRAYAGLKIPLVSLHSLVSAASCSYPPSSSRDRCRITTHRYTSINHPSTTRGLRLITCTTTSPTFGYLPRLRF